MHVWDKGIAINTPEKPGGKPMSEASDARDVQSETRVLVPKRPKKELPLSGTLHLHPRPEAGRFSNFTYQAGPIITRPRYCAFRG